MKITLNRLALPALLLLLSAATSCIYTDPNMGYGLIPGDQLLETKQMTTSLPVTLKMADSIATTSSTSIVFGSINSSVSGVSEYGCATVLVPFVDLDSALDVGTNRRIKEFYLGLALRRTECMDERSQNIIQNINVYRMVKDFDSTTVYNCSFSEDYYDRTKPISVNGITYNGSEDTLKIVFTEEYAKEILDSLSKNPSLLDTLSSYNKAFHGIYFTTASSIPGVDEGRINNFKIQSYGMLYYTADFGDRKDVDTSLLFATGITSNTVESYFALNTSTMKSSAINNTDPTRKLIVEGNAGIKPVISASYVISELERLVAGENVTPDRIMLSRATLRLPFEFPQDYTILDNSYPAILSPSIRMHTESGRVLYTCISDVNISGEDPGEINRSLGYYSPDITHYLQRLLKKEKDELSEDDDIWLMPTTNEPDENDEDTSSSEDYYYNYNPYYYYDPYGYYDYGYGYGYGYGGYYNPYGYYGNYYYGSTSSESESSTITLDNISYVRAELNGTDSERNPQLIITYFILPEDE